MEADNRKFPDLRFPEFVGFWNERKFGEIFTFQPTNSLSRENLNYETGVYRNIHYGDIHKKFHSLFDITQEEVPFINENIVLKNVTDNNLCKEGDVLFADASEDYEDIGKCIEIVNTNHEQIVAGLHTIHARPDSLNLAIRFSAHLFKTEKVKSQIKLFAQGIKVLSISSGRLSDIILSLPSLSEQTKIASFLTAVDDKIRQLTRKKELLEQYKKGVMQKIFKREIRFRRSLSEAEGEEGKEYPEWEKYKFGEIYRFISTNSLSRENLNYSEGEIKNIHYGDIHTKFSTLFVVEDEEVPYINSNSHLNKIDEENFCKAGDLIIADASEDYDDIGKTIEISNTNNEKILSGLHTIHARPDLGIMHVGFGGYLMKSESVKNQIKTIAQGIKVLSISSSRLSNLNVEIPSKPEQSKIGTFLYYIDQKINLVTRHLENMQTWKKGLLQKLFV